MDDEKFKRINTSDGKWYFVFEGDDGIMIGVSELFANVAEMEKAIQVIKKSGKTQKIFMDCI
ncbi:MAG: YegP family protein [Chitinophagaceae bacterium]